ncbi:hypothetical protein VTH82DRAFT_5819 [Thermothelomyces myriococcoides]
MDHDQADSNLLLLSLNLSDSEPEEAVPPGDATASTTNAAVPTTENQPTRAERTALSEEAFQTLKRSYRPKVENGNIHSNISFLPSSTPTTSTTGNSPNNNDNDNASKDDDDDNDDDEPLPKPAAQELLHAAEELYFFRRYAEAASFLRRVLESTTSTTSSESSNGDAVGDGTGRRGRGRRGRRRRIDDDTRQLLGYYLGRCEARLGGT